MSKARQNLTHILLTAVTALGLLSTVMILTDPPPVDLDAPPTIFQSNSQALVRNVASTEETLVDLDCQSEAQALETASLRFRLKGSPCSDDKKDQPRSTQVKNNSNGYVATVFHRSAQEFTTDFINLNEGSNEIEVRFETDDGVLQKKLTVVRTPASATPGSAPQK